MNAPAAVMDRPPLWRALVAAARPATIGASVAPVLVGSALANAHGSFRAAAAFWALFGAIAIQIGTNLANDYFDWKQGADRADRLGPPRATQRGWISPRAVAWLSVLFFSLAMVAGVQLAAIGGWPIVVLGLSSIAAGVAYTAGPYALAYVGLAEPFVIGFFGVAAVGGTYYVHADRVDPAAWIAGLAHGFLASAILVVNNLRDRRGDARANKRTLVVRFGERFGRIEYLVFAFGAFLLAAIGAWIDRPGWIAALLALPIAIGVARRVWARDGAALNPLLGATAKLELIFALLLAIGVSI